MFSIIMFCISNFAGVLPVDWPYSANFSPARRNFLIVATCIPLLWLLAHLFHWIHNEKLDVGVATCGARFIFGERFFV